LFYSFKERLQQQHIKRELYFNSRFACGVIATMLVNVKNKFLFAMASFIIAANMATTILSSESLGTGYKPPINMTLACHREARSLHSYSLLVSLSDSHPPLVSATRPLSVVFEMEAPPSKCTT